MQFKEFISTYKTHILVALVVLLLFLSGVLLFTNSSSSKSEKQAKQEVKELHKENESLLKDLKSTKDSIEVLHNLAIKNNNRDTIYINQIKYINIKTNEEISHFNSLSTDAQYSEFSNLISEYSKTRFNKDSLPSNGKGNWGFNRTKKP